MMQCIAMHGDADAPPNAAELESAGKFQRFAAAETHSVYERVEFPDFFISSGEANHPLTEEEVPRPLNRDLQLGR